MKITKIKNGLITIVVFIFAMMAGVIGKEIGKSFFNNKVTSAEFTSQKLLNKMASEINKNLPMHIDSGTELRAAVGEKGRLVYQYVLLNIKSEDILPNQLIKELSGKIKNSSVMLV